MLPRLPLGFSGTGLDALGGTDSDPVSMRFTGPMGQPPLEPHRRFHYRDYTQADVIRRMQAMNAAYPQPGPILPQPGINFSEPGPSTSSAANSDLDYVPLTTPFRPSPKGKGKVLHDEEFARELAWVQDWTAKRRQKAADEDPGERDDGTECQCCFSNFAVVRSFYGHFVLCC